MRVSLGLILSLTSSCFYKDDPNFCPEEPEHHNCLNLIGPRCDGPEDCSGDKALCDVGGTGFCVQCTPEDKSACQGPTPSCISNTCQPCTAHDQCDSKVCLMDLDGTCANSSDVAYVQAGGTGTMCTLNMPCGTLGAAVSISKPYIKIAAGVVNDSNVTTIEGKKVSLLADPGAILTREATGPILLVRGANTNVSIYDLRITGATGSIDSAIQLEPGSGTPALSLNRVTVDQNQGRGVSSTGGSLSISQSTFLANARGGISVSAAEATFNIINNFIVRNGDAVTPFGGVNLDVVASGSSRFEFNTIADNLSTTGATRSGGILCNITGFMAPNNIVARNRLGTDATAPNAQTLGVCTYPTSKVQSDVAGLNFASPDMLPYSYKLLEGSSAIDQATTPSLVTIDHDGDPRPQGAQKDLGADEFRR